MPATRRRRVITDQRREQNRQAQTRYRQKVRTRLQYAEQLESANSGAHNPTFYDHPGRNANEALGNRTHGDYSTDNLSRSGSAATAGDSTSSSFIIQPFLSDLRLDSIDRPYISLISACVENSKLIGIPDIFVKDLASPFYNKQREDSDISVDSSSDRWSHLPRDLYPTPLQLSTPHEAWLDCIPLPEFRDRVLTYMPLENSKDAKLRRELENDVDNDGLVCWGGCADNRVRGSTPTGTFGTPWDSRNWEARPWFLKKWKAITGGLDGALGANSVWWWSLRGEEMPDPF